jgi:pimeloyl-ACP methyl ester carboxylesterase
MRVNGIELHVEDTGGDRPVVCFSHGLLWSARMYEAQVAALQGRWRCIAWDHRGQGRSEKPPGDEVPVEQVYEDAVALIEALGVAPVHFVGLSMGGFVGMRLAARRPDLVRSLVLLETAGDPEPQANIGKYKAMNFIARIGALSLVAPRVMPIMFGRTFLTDPARAADRARWEAILRANDRSIWRAVNGVIRRRGVADELGRIRVPTLQLHGDEDAAIVMERAERTAAAIPGAELHVVRGAGHSSTVEQPDAVNAELLAFFGRVEAGG